MKILEISKNPSAKRAVIIFGGFACGENFAKFLPELPHECDAFLAFDYRKMGISEMLKHSKKYEQVDVIGWSFGVWAAACFCSMAKNVGRKIALCGSPTPVSDALGIPSRVFEITTNKMDASARTKFYAKVCGESGGSEYLCGRSAPELKAELESFASVFSRTNFSDTKFDLAVAAKDDGIFRVENLRRAFGKELVEVEGAHLSRAAFDVAAEFLKRAERVRLGFERSAASYPMSAAAQAKIASTLADIAFQKAPSIFAGEKKKLLEVGCGTGFLTRAIAAKIGDGKIPQLWLNDICGELCVVAAIFWGGKSEILEGDFLSADLGRKKFDGIISASCFHWFENQKKLFEKLHGALSSGGKLVFSSFEKGNLDEVSVAVRSVFGDGKGLKYATLEESVAMLGACGFDVEYSSREKIALEFNSPLSVLRHLKETGVNSGFSSFWTRKTLSDFSSAYPRSSDGKIRLTYSPIYVVAKKRRADS